MPSSSTELPPRHQCCSHRPPAISARGADNIMALDAPTSRRDEPLLGAHGSSTRISPTRLVAGSGGRLGLDRGDHIVRVEVRPFLVARHLEMAGEGPANPAGVPRLVHVSRATT